MMVDDNFELPLDDAAKIMGCWNTLAKRTHAGDPHPAFPPDATPMKRAVGFLENIKSSQRVAAAFEQVVEAVGGADATGTAGRPGSPRRRHHERPGARHRN